MGVIFTIIVAGVIFLGGLIVIFFGGSMLRKRAEIRRTPVRPVNTLDAGLVSVQGRTASFRELFAPFSARPCVYCEAKVEKLTYLGSGRKAIPLWEKHAEWKSSDPFYIEDETGRALVSTAEGDAFLDLEVSFDQQNASEVARQVTKDIPVHILEAMERMSIPYVDEFNSLLPLRFTEHCLEVGSEVYVLGRHSDDQDEISWALGDDPSIDMSKHKWIITRKDIDDTCFIAPGDSRFVCRDLLKSGILCLLFGSLASTLSAGFLFILFYGLN